MDFKSGFMGYEARRSFGSTGASRWPTVRSASTVSCQRILRLGAKTEYGWKALTLPLRRRVDNARRVCESKLWLQVFLTREGFPPRC